MSAKDSQVWPPHNASSASSTLKSHRLRSKSKPGKFFGSECTKSILAVAQWEILLKLYLSKAIWKNVQISKAFLLESILNRFLLELNPLKFKFLE